MQLAGCADKHSLLEVTSLNSAQVMAMLRGAGVAGGKAEDEGGKEEAVTAVEHQEPGARGVAGAGPLDRPPCPCQTRTSISRRRFPSSTRASLGRSVCPIPCYDKRMLKADLYHPAKRRLAR